MVAHASAISAASLLEVFIVLFLFKVTGDRAVVQNNDSVGVVTTLTVAASCRTGSLTALLGRTAVGPDDISSASKENFCPSVFYPLCGNAHSANKSLIHHR